MQKLFESTTLLIKKLITLQISNVNIYKNALISNNTIIY